MTHYTTTQNNMQQTIEAAYLAGYEPSGKADEYSEALEYLTNLNK